MVRFLPLFFLSPRQFLLNHCHQHHHRHHSTLAAILIFCPTLSIFSALPCIPSFYLFIPFCTKNVCLFNTWFYCFAITVLQCILLQSNQRIHKGSSIAGNLSPFRIFPLVHYFFWVYDVCALKRFVKCSANW